MGGDIGAGDEFIVTGQVRELQKSDPRKVRIEYERVRWHPLWDHNPRIAMPHETGDFQSFRPRQNGLRPYCAEKSPQRWRWKAWRPPVGEIYLSRDERAFGDVNAGHVVIEPNIKGSASPNKRWPWDRWLLLIERMCSAGIVPVQLGPRDTVRIPGARFVETRGIRQAAAVLSRARAAVLTEGALHHIAAGVGCPAVVIFGGYISPEVTGYDSQVNLFTGHGLGCGMRTPCECCERAMDAITVERVFEAFRKALG